jgi:transcriptional regulator with XRE-family HTH domain
MSKTKSKIDPEHLPLVDLKVLGDAIRRLRQKYEWSQSDLATRLECDAAFISLVENGRRGMSLPFFESLAKVLEVPPKWLMILAFPETGSSAPAASHVDKLGEELKKYIRRVLFNE